MDIGRNITAIRNRIDAAARKSGRSGRDITIVAATKYASADIIKGLSEYDIHIAGENRVQDFLAKYCDIGGSGTEWHFIGRLQSNKVKYIVDKVSLIHSADRPQLIGEIERQCAIKGIKGVDVLIEVNIGGEEQKGGIAPGEVTEFYESIKRCGRVRVRGLMAVMPLNAGNGEKCRNLYLQMRALYDILRDKDADVNILSMGMSEDFETAVECGSTMVRLGRALFS